MYDDFLDTLDDMGADADKGLACAAGEEDAYIEWLKRLVDGPEINDLRKAVAAGDAAAAEGAVHTLKGVSASLGLLPLTDACFFMLKDFRAGHAQEAMAQMPQVEAEYQRWAQVIGTLK